VFVRVLGTLVVEAGTAGGPAVELVVPGAKERALLGRLLVCPGRAVPVDLLVDDLWDGSPPPTARKSLQAHVVRLRTALEPERARGSPGRYVVHRRDGYLAAVGPEEFDVGLATAEADAGRALLASGDAARGREHLGAALALWRGEPFADWHDVPWAETERQRLTVQHAGALLGRVDADLALGRHLGLVPELETLVAGDPLNEAWWSRLMVALYRCDRQGEALAAARRARVVLAEELGVDPGPTLRRVEQAILEQSSSLEAAFGGVAGRPDVTAGEVVPGVCPYRGLAVYDVGDAALLHGRGAAVRGLVAKACAAPVVVVSGPSGAGKSSLVRAGFLPAVARGDVPGGRDWRQVVISPGLTPVDRLAPLLQHGSDPARSRGICLVVDQFEELWTAGIAAGERAAFLATLLDLVEAGGLARVVLVVRGDHLGRLAEVPELAEAAMSGLVLVPPMTEAEIREVLEGPAAVAGLSVEPELAEDILHEAGGRPGVLPLLSTALVATWERRRDRTLTLAGYQESGGLTGALAGIAEAVLAGLDPPARQLARPLLVRLATEGEGGAVVRRPVPLSELALDRHGDGAGGSDGRDGGRRRRMLEAFVAARLLTVDTGSVEVTHESLFGAWPRLAAWLAEDAQGRAVRAHLAPEARGWSLAGRPPDRLYRGARLAAAQDWLDRPDADPTADERAFVAASTALAEAELAEARAQTRRERAGRRRTRWLAVVLAAASLIAAASGGLALQRQRQATESALRAGANRLAAESANASSLDLSLLLAAEAYRTRATPQTEDGLLAAAIEHRQVARVYRPGGVVRHLAASADGRTLYAHAEQQVVAWDLTAEGQQRVIFRYTSKRQHPTDVAVSLLPVAPARGLVAVVVPATARDASSTVRLLEPDGDTRWSLGLAALGGWPLSVAFTRDGRGLAVEVMEDYAGRAPFVRYFIVDVASGSPRPVGPRLPVGIGAILDPWVSGLSSDGASASVGEYAGGRFRVGSLDLVRGSVTWLDLEGRSAADSWIFPVAGGMVEAAADGAVHWYPAGAVRKRQTLADHTSSAFAAAADTTGRVLVTGGTDRRVVVHQLADGGWDTVETLDGHRGDVLEVLVSADGRRAFSTSEDQTVMQWDLADADRFGTRIPSYETPADSTFNPVTNGPPIRLDDRTLVVPMVGGMPPGNPVGPSRMAAAFLDSATLRMTDWVPVGNRPMTSIPEAAASLSRDGRWIAVTAAFSVSVLDARSRHRVVDIPLDGLPGGPENGVAEYSTAVAWSPDGSELLLGMGGGEPGPPGARGDVVVVDTRTWQPRRRILAGGLVESLTPSPDGRFLAVADVSGRITITDADTHREIRGLQASGEVRAVSFSPDGSRFAAVGGSKRLDVWDVGTGQPFFGQPPYFPGAGTSIQWRPGGHELVYGGEDGTAQIIDLDTGARRGVPLPMYRDGGPGVVHVLAGDDDRLVLLPGYRPGYAPREGMIYPLRPDRWLARACAVAHRDLTRAEWAAYVPERPYRATCPAAGHRGSRPM
jgi:DNA-binding SARP family transcriptional activator/WD40 repeat protein